MATTTVMSQKAQYAARAQGRWPRPSARSGSAGQAIRRWDQHRPVTVPSPLGTGVDLHQAHAADLAALIPGITRTGHTVAFTAENMTAAYRLLQLFAPLTHIGP